MEPEALWIDLTPIPIGLLLLTAVVAVAWMLLLDVRTYVWSARNNPRPLRAPAYGKGCVRSPDVYGRV